MVSSDGHRLNPFRFDEYNFDSGKTYNKWYSYGQSKTANMLMAVSLAEKLGIKRNLLAFSLHPGVIWANLTDHLDMDTDFDGLPHNGSYLIDCRIGDPFSDTIKPWEINSLESRKLWDLIEKLLGQEFAY